MNFDTIMVRKETSIVDDFAIFLLKNFGEAKWPGISKAKVAFCNPNDQIPAKEGTLFIGVNGGQFDKHTATLMAKTLGVEKDPALKVLLSYMRFIESGEPYDKKRIKPEERYHPLGLSATVKLLHQDCPNSPKKVMDLAMSLIKAKYHEQLRFFNETRKEFEKIAKIEEIQGPYGRMIKLATIVSDNEQMNKFARSTYGGNAAVIIQKKLSGHTHIFTNRYYKIFLYDTAQMIRLAEQETRGKVINGNWKSLASPGIMKGVEEWKFDTVRQMLLNVGNPTQLSVEQIKDIIKIGVNPNAFTSELAAQCRKGICTPKKEKDGKCSWKKLGLQRCRKIRWEMNQ